MATRIKRRARGRVKGLKTTLTKERLIDLYWVQGKTLAEIGRMQRPRVTATAVGSRMQRLGIARRPTGPTGRGKLNPELVRRVRRRLRAGEDGGTIGRTVGRGVKVTRQTIHLIKTGKIWADVGT